MNRIALGLAASAAIAFASPTSAAVTITDYSLTGSGGAAGLDGTLSLAFDDSANTYALDDLNFLIGTTTFDTSNAHLDPFGAGLILYGLTDTFNYSGTDDFYIIFNPANGFPQLRSISFTLTTNPTSILGGSVTIESIDAAVPEPSTWGMMLLGFGAAGLALRRRRPRQLANATA